MLYGRAVEQAALEELVRAARDSRSGALVLRGEAGIGKTALLDWIDREASATGVRVMRITGIEPEADLPFAGLAQLLWPVQDQLDALPEPQAAALRAVLGTVSAPAADRFLTGLAVLTLLADLAERGPVLCLVDSAEWLDRASADALLFAARRLAAEGVAMVFATREEGLTAPGLTELRPSRLAADDATLLLTTHGLAPAMREQVIVESAGNPLALIEFAAAQPGNPTGAVHLRVADRVLASFRDQIGALPERTRLMLLIAAAEGRGDLPLLLRSGQLMGVGLEDLEEAERAGLVREDEGRLVFRHPLIATAAYQGAPLARRVAVHRAMLELAPSPECRAQHLPAATAEPDADVAAELAAAGDRAAGRTAYTSAARFYQQAARLAPEPAEQARLLGVAAAAALAGGHAGQAAELAERSGATQVRAAALFELGDGKQAAQLLIDGAATAEPEQAVAMLRTSATYAWFSCDPDPVRAAAERLTAMGADDLMVRGLAHLVEEDYAHGLPELARYLAGADGDDAARMLHSGVILGADASTLALAAAEVTRLREHGRIGSLPQALQLLAQVQVRTGLHGDAEATVAEAVAIARDTGLEQRVALLNGVAARIAAIEGDEERCRRLAREAPQEDKATCDIALSLLELGTGRYEPALHRLETAWSGPGRNAVELIVAGADQVEAAVRLGWPERAAQPLRRFEDWAQASGQQWAKAVALRCRALLSDDEDDHLQALRLHEGAGRPFERARTELLYGEWLRRARRRADARVPLRSALETFERLRAAPWADRARAELRATGESGATAAQATAPHLLDRLTPQELQVVRLAAAGHSSREIAARLFLGARTVEHHLYKAYPKLGVTSRRQLAALDLD
ncbi:ATP-binding protein [Nonomuraea sp. NPDC059194]|uniref:ATP-binding protein n=1 Tax=Nonomuraea sp. NPDC059194 TaxID=3346764 RepID=UPI00368DBC9D